MSKIEKDSNLLHNIVLSALKALQIDKVFKPIPNFLNKNKAVFIFKGREKNPITFDIHFSGIQPNYEKGELMMLGELICTFEVDGDYLKYESPQDIVCRFSGEEFDACNFLINHIL